jgi:hypothetical protein
MAHRRFVALAILCVAILGCTKTVMVVPQTVEIPVTVEVPVTVVVTSVPDEKGPLSRSAKIPDDWIEYRGNENPSLILRYPPEWEVDYTYIGRVTFKVPPDSGVGIVVGWPISPHHAVGDEASIDSIVDEAISENDDDNIPSKLISKGAWYYPIKANYCEFELLYPIGTARSIYLVVPLGPEIGIRAMMHVGGRCISVEEIENLKLVVASITSAD